MPGTDHEAHAARYAAEYADQEYQDYLNELANWAATVVYAKAETCKLDKLDCEKPRIKSVDSFQRKAAKSDPENSAMPKYQHPLNKITDQVGLRITVLLNGDMKTVVDALRECGEIDVQEEVDKEVEAKANRSFGYSARHLLFLGRKTQGAPEPPGDCQAATVELQLRTAAFDAWSRVEHKVRYKNDAKADDRRLPLSISRKFDGAAAAISIADDLLQEAINEKLQYDAASEASSDGGPFDTESLRAAMHRLFPSAPENRDGRTLRWMLAILSEAGLQDSKKLIEAVESVDREAIAVAMKSDEMRWPTTQVRRLDDTLLAWGGERYIEAASVPLPTSQKQQTKQSRAKQLESRLAVLRGFGLAT